MEQTPDFKPKQSKHVEVVSFRLSTDEDIPLQGHEEDMRIIELLVKELKNKKE